MSARIPLDPARTPSYHRQTPIGPLLKPIRATARIPLGLYRDSSGRLPWLDKETAMTPPGDCREFTEALRGHRWGTSSGPSRNTTENQSRQHREFVGPFWGHRRDSIGTLPRNHQNSARMSLGIHLAIARTQLGHRWNFTGTWQCDLVRTLPGPGLDKSGTSLGPGWDIAGNW